MPDLPKRATAACEDCFYFTCFNNNPGLGECHVVPPVIWPHNNRKDKETGEFTPSRMGMFPVIPGTSFCGEFERR